MHRILKAVAVLAFAVAGPVAVAAEVTAPELPERGNAAAGAAKAAVCSACHGQDGQAILADYPDLGGQHYSYLLQQMEYYRSGERYAPLMAGQLDNRSDQDLKDIAAYYAEMDKQVGTAEGDLELGEQLYRAGLADKGVPACNACHSPRGLGNGPAAFPVLSGQNAAYTAAQLRAYRAGERQTDEDLGQMMRGVAENLDDDEIDAVAGYVQGLH